MYQKHIYKIRHVSKNRWSGVGQISPRTEIYQSSPSPRYVFWRPSLSYMNVPVLRLQTWRGEGEGYTGTTIQWSYITDLYVRQSHRKVSLLTCFAVHSCVAISTDTAKFSAQSRWGYTQTISLTRIRAAGCYTWKTKRLKLHYNKALLVKQKYGKL